MMFRIAICDDDQHVCNKLEAMVYEYTVMHAEDIIIDVYYSAKNLAMRIKEDGPYDLIFLDIEMEELTGIEFGRILREDEHDEMTKIVYISNRDNYAMDLFRIRPQDFLTKPLMQKDIFYNIDKSIEIIKGQRKYFMYSYKHKSMKVATNDILYFESNNRQLSIHTTEGVRPLYGKLDEIEKQLDGKYFWRIHKSHLIHIQHVKRLEYKRVIMDNGKELGISQTYRPLVKKLHRALMGKGD